ncbi:MAG: FtsW/RodA/SpoVE family cell cycle protein [Oscillospiraceae bacterium]|nr:FtsW/RodA/SpoVE family cell cycle protein [Oscillospiraceae bacterium]
MWQAFCRKLSIVINYYSLKGGADIKKIKPYVKLFFERADIFLLCICIICAIFGIVMVYLAVVGMEEGGALTNPTKFVIVQTFSMFIGIGGFVVLTVLDSDLLGEQWKALAAINILLLVALVVFGQDDGTGNKSWIRFAGIGVQPSEIIKILYIIISAKHMTYIKEYKDINGLMSVVQMAGHFLIWFGLIVVVSADLGSATVLLCIFLVMFFFLGVRLYWFAAGGAAVAAAIPLLWTYFLKDYQKQRLIAPYDPTIDPDGWGITWQTTQSKLTLASGRLTGVEPGHRYSVFTGKHTDFIFSCVGENLGMIGCLVVILLLVIIIVHCFRVGLQSGRTYDMLVCVGVGSAVAFQTFINIGMCLGITPVIGITLPFFSYGGSSMVTMFCAMGLISGTKFKPKPQHGSLLY